MKKVNRLVGEKLSYLLQHRHNPVDWFPWGKEAFEKARAEGKPIFLSIGYSTCHWCHVMERESFENADVAAFFERAFCERQSGSRGASGCGQDLYDGGAGDGGAGGLAVERVFDRRIEAVLRLHLFSDDDGSAWKKFRCLLTDIYNKLTIVNIVANQITDMAFSSFTSIAEA